MDLGLSETDSDLVWFATKLVFRGKAVRRFGYYITGKGGQLPRLQENHIS